MSPNNKILSSFSPLFSNFSWQTIGMIFYLLNMKVISILKSLSVSNIRKPQSRTVSFFHSTCYMLNSQDAKDPGIFEIQFQLFFFQIFFLLMVKNFTANLRCIFFSRSKFSTGYFNINLVRIVPECHIHWWKCLKNWKWFDWLFWKTNYFDLL